MKPHTSTLQPTDFLRWKEFLDHSGPIHATKEHWRTDYAVATYKNGKGEVISEVHYLPNGQIEYFVKGAK